MQAGLLRRRIAIVTPAVSQDPFGQPTAGTSSQPGTPILRTWARISALTSREIFALGPGFTSNVTHKITIRFPEVIVRAEMHVLYKTRTFRVQATSDPDEARRELDLICLEQS